MPSSTHSPIRKEDGERKAAKKNVETQILNKNGQEHESESEKLKSIEIETICLCHYYRENFRFFGEGIITTLLSVVFFLAFRSGVNGFVDSTH